MLAKMSNRIFLAIAVTVGIVLSLAFIVWVAVFVMR